MSSIKNFIHTSRSRGVTTTHPWCSVFTRSFSYIFSRCRMTVLLVFSRLKNCVKMKDTLKRSFSCFLCLLIILCTGVCEVHAEAFPIPPVWLPINPYNAEGLKPNFELLNDDQKKIVYEIIGSYNSSFLGQASTLLINPFTTIHNVRSWWQDCGEALVDQILLTSFDATLQAPRAMQDLIGSATYKASTYDSYQEFVNDTEPSTQGDSVQRYYQFAPELTVAFKNWYAANGGIEDWQFHTVPFKSNKVWQSITVSPTSNYWVLLNGLALPHVRYNPNWSSDPNYWGNGYLSSSFFQTYTNLFLNTSDGKYYFCNDSGLPYSSNVVNFSEVYLYYGNANSRNNGSSFHYRYNYPLRDTFLESVKALYNDSYTVMDSFDVFLEDFVKHVYVGADWNSKHEIYNVDDLNYSVPNEYIDQTSEDAFVDYTGLLARIADQVTDLKEALKDNALVRDGTNAIPYADAITKAIDMYLEQPKSGVLIVPSLFSNLGKYITYLYQQTKPLILYTRDLITCLTFDGTGMSWVFFGAVSCGLIGGVLCKFLL